MIRKNKKSLNRSIKRLLCPEAPPYKRGKECCKCCPPPQCSNPEFIFEGGVFCDSCPDKKLPGILHVDIPWEEITLISGIPTVTDSGTLTIELIQTGMFASWQYQQTGDPSSTDCLILTLKWTFSCLSTSDPNIFCFGFGYLIENSCPNSYIICFDSTTGDQYNNGYHQLGLKATCDPFQIEAIIDEGGCQSPSTILSYHGLCGNNLPGEGRISYQINNPVIIKE